MLVLSGRRNDEIYLSLPGGQRITVSVVEVRGKMVRLGFEAPRAITILRRDAKNKQQPVQPKPRLSDTPGGPT